MNLKEKLVDCKRCNSSACTEVYDEESSYKVYLCMTCGFSSSPGAVAANKEIIEQGLPELYKDLCFEDKDGLLWYPTSINLPQNGMVFADGTSTENWKWSAVPVRRITLKEKLKFPPGATHVPNMKKLKSFGQLEFMDALESVKYFELIQK